MSSYGSSTVKRHRRTQSELAEIDDAIAVAVEEDYPVTLRGVYYRVESAGCVPKTEAGYRLVGRQLLKLRREGVVPYSMITDGTRWVTKPRSWSTVDQMLDDAAASYRKALWHGQDAEVHVFTEKDAISGVILPVTGDWDVPLGVLRGYASESFVYSVGETIKNSSKNSIYIYQLGDHDPSGTDAWRVFREGVAGFLGEKVTPEMAERAAKEGVYLAVGKPLGVSEVDAPDDDYVSEDQVTYLFSNDRSETTRTVTFARLAVTPEQIEDWELPTRPTKKSDTRAKSFSGESIEVDAIRAPRLRALVEQAITSHIHGESWNRLLDVEQLERESLETFLESFRAMASS